MNARLLFAGTVLAGALVAGGCAAPGAGQSSTGYLTSTENVAKIQVGKTTVKEVEQALGAPVEVSRDSRRGWDYWLYRIHRRSKIWIGVSSDGVVREVVEVYERTGNPGFI
jgi:outer membrane protein assembly factor BamE (lipoprotein component of BamABCDE complex)